MWETFVSNKLLFCQKLSYEERMARRLLGPENATCMFDQDQYLDSPTEQVQQLLPSVLHLHVQRRSTHGFGLRFESGNHPPLCCLFEKSTFIKFHGFRETVSLSGPLDGATNRHGLCVCVRARACMTEQDCSAWKPLALRALHHLFSPPVTHPCKHFCIVPSSRAGLSPSIFAVALSKISLHRWQHAGVRLLCGRFTLTSFILFLQADVLQPDSPEGRRTGGLWWVPHGPWCRHHIWSLRRNDFG